MHWKVKAQIFRILSRMPFGKQLHFQLQKHISKEWPRSNSVLAELLVAARRVYQSTEGLHGHFLEVGAGRDLAVAVALRLLGVQHVTCIDVARLAKPALVNHAAGYMAACLGVKAPSLLDWDAIARFGISYRAPTDLKHAGLEPHVFDCFFSIDTLEHIPLDDLRDLLSTCRHLLKSNGMTVHCIDYSDHYARGDNGLSRFNFLTYTERDWVQFNSPFQYVNRMRHSQYLSLFSEAGMRLVNVESDRVSPQRPILDCLAPQFEKFDVDDLFTIRAMIVAQV